MANRRPAAWRYCPRGISFLWFAAALAALTFAGACRRGVPLVDTAPKPPVANGTITGMVRGPAGTSPVAGRTVECINVDTGEHFTVTTGSTGGFTIKLPPGKYRLELALHEGETLTKRPNVVDLTRGDIDSHIEFVIAGARVARPRGPAYRLDNGLGSPVA